MIPGHADSPGRRLGLVSQNGRPPGAWAILFLTLCAISLTIALLAIPRVGMGWDTAGNTHTASVLRVEGIPGDYEQAVKENPGCGLCEFRGILSEQVGFIIFKIVSQKADSEIGFRDVGIIRGQAVFNWVLFGSAVLAGSVAAWTLRRRLVHAALTGALIASQPMLVGHTVVNFKDAPVAFGIVLVFSGLILWRTHRSFLWSLAGVGLGTTGAFVMLAQRPSATALLAVAVFVSMVSGILAGKRKSWLQIVRKLGWFWTPVAIGSALLLVASNPYARLNIFRWLVEATLTASDFPWSGPVRIFGMELQSTDLPVWYLPATIWANTTLPLSLFALLIFTSGFVSLKRMPRLHRELLGGGLGFLVITPLLIVLSGATLYDGSRHVLFLYALGGLYLGLFLTEMDCTLRAHPLVRYLPNLPVAAFVVLWQLGSNLVWFPYSYAHLNLAVALTAEDRDFDADYWGVTAQEGVSLLKNDSDARVAVIPADNTAWHVGGYSPYKTSQRPVTPDSFPAYQFVRGSDLFQREKCKPILEIRRAGVLLGSGAICEPDALRQRPAP